MAGIYLHIPFCKRKCFYCDFYKSTNLRLKSQFLVSLEKEIADKKQLLQSLKFSTFYIGGGTPSVLSGDELLKIFELFQSYIDISSLQEITIEINPDDFNESWLSYLKQTPVNRISFGLQSIDDDLLKMMNRRHINQQSIDAVNLAYLNGYSNLSVDLIYGLPGLTEQQWLNTLNEIVKMPVTHISAYHLTYESGTVFYNRLKKGLLKESDEENSLIQYNLLVNVLKQYGFHQYELSAFTKPDFESRHNTLYWSGDDYVGFGPSAHSFYNGSRVWNVSDVNQYIDLLNSGDDYFQCEILTDIDRYNELVMLGLRTVKGISIPTLNVMDRRFVRYFNAQSKPFLNSGALIVDNGYCFVSPASRFITDKIIEDLFFVD